MSNKIQGEGDYEAARRFNKDEQEFVKRKYGKKHGPEKGDPYAAQSDDVVDQASDDDQGDDDQSDDQDETLERDVRQPSRHPGIEFPNRR